MELETRLRGSFKAILVSCGNLLGYLYTNSSEKVVPNPPSAIHGPIDQEIRKYQAILDEVDVEIQLSQQRIRRLIEEKKKRVVEEEEKRKLAEAAAAAKREAEELAKREAEAAAAAAAKAKAEEKSADTLAKESGKDEDASVSNADGSLSMNIDKARDDFNSADNNDELLGTIDGPLNLDDINSLGEGLGDDTDDLFGDSATPFESNEKSLDGATADNNEGNDDNTDNNEQQNESDLLAGLDVVMGDDNGLGGDSITGGFDETSLGAFDNDLDDLLSSVENGNAQNNGDGLINDDMGGLFGDNFDFMLPTD